MNIKRIVIENFKSIKKIDFQPNSGINIFIGENSAGKSNIFNAVNWLLGPSYPTFNSISANDHFLGNLDNKIHIGIQFDDNSYLELCEEKEISGKTRKGLFLNGGFISGDDRERYSCAHVGIDREIVDYLPSNRWSLIGRFLLDVNEKFKIDTTENGTPKLEVLKNKLDEIRDKILFTVDDENGQNIMAKFIEILKSECAKQMNRSPGDIDINFNLYDPWNFYRTLQIIVKESDINIQFQASQLGMGAQASITMAILRAYSELKLGGINPLFIDEPELFLHPQAQKNFYNLLKKITDENNIQIFYTTHSPYLLKLYSFDEIHLVRKVKERGTFLKKASINDFINDLKIRHSRDADPTSIRLVYKNAFEQTADSLSSLEAFFSRKIILVEGESEALVLPYLFDKIDDFDYVHENITIVKCGSKNEIDRFFRLYTEFGIPCFLLFDGDKHLGDDPKKENNALFELLGDDKTKDFPGGIVKNNYLGFEYDFNKALSDAGFDDVYNKYHPERSPKGLKLFNKVKIQTEEIGIAAPDWIGEIIEALKNLPTEVDSILKNTNA